MAQKTPAFLIPSVSLVGALIAGAPTLAKLLGYPIVPYEPAISAIGIAITALSSFWNALNQSATTEIIKGHLTSGDSYATCSMSLMDVPGRGREWALYIQQHGDFPIHDAAIEVMELKPSRQRQSWHCRLVHSTRGNQWPCALSRICQIDFAGRFDISGQMAVPFRTSPAKQLLAREYLHHAPGVLSPLVQFLRRSSSKKLSILYFLATMTAKLTGPGGLRSHFQRRLRRL